MFLFIFVCYLQEPKLKSFMTNKSDLKSIKSAISCIRYLLVNATRFQTDETTFSTELQQLGLPIEHSTAICRVYKEQSKNTEEFLARNSLTGNFKLVSSSESEHQKSLIYLNFMDHIHPLHNEI